MSNENNKYQIDIDNLFKQNVNDLSSIKELYRKLKEIENKITQIKYIDSNLANKLKKDYEKLKRIILDENVQAKLSNDIEKINSQLDTNTNEIEDLSINRLMIDKINPHTNKLGYITPEMFGKINDGIDVTTILQNCINYAIENNVKVVFTNNKEYCFTNLTIAKPCSIDFNNAILKSYNDDPNTSLLNIGLESDSFETKTFYSSIFNISIFLVDLDN